MCKNSSPEAVYTRYKDRYADILKGFSPDTFLAWVLDVRQQQIHCSGMRVFPFGEAQPPPTALKEWVARMHPDDVTRVKETWRSVISGAEHGGDMETFYRMRCPNGSFVWFLSKGTVAGRDEHGRALFLTGILISVNVLAEKLESAVTWRERSAFALDAARDGLWDWNAKTNEVYYSPRYIAMMGYEPGEFGNTLEAWSSRVHKDDLEQTLHRQLAFAASPAGGDLFECTYRFLAADGTYRWILGRGKVLERDESGRAKRIIGLHTDVTELRAAQESLTRLVNHDTLTSLHSRLYFERTFNALVASGRRFAFIYADVDMLKAVNDQLGHEAGDRLLSKAAYILRDAVRSSDIVARMGGDEFAVLMPGCSGRGARAIVEKLEERLRQRNSDPERMPVLLSVGSAATDEGMQASMLLNAADQEMLRAKAAARSESRARMQVWIERRAEIFDREVPPSV